jgi:hypothetical protein
LGIRNLVLKVDTDKFVRLMEKWNPALNLYRHQSARSGQLLRSM